MDNSYFSKRHQIQLMFLTCWFLVGFSKGQVNDVWTSIVMTFPKEVAETNTTLSLKIQPIQYMEVGAAIELILPKSGVVQFDPSVYSTPATCQFQGTEVLPDEVPCSFEKTPDGREMITWISSHDPVGEFEPINLYALKCVHNPLSTQITDDFEMRIYSDSTKANLQDQQLIDLYMQATFIPIESDYNHLKQSESGNREVGKVTPAELTLKSNVPLPSSAFITVDMPKVNPSAPTPLRKPYIDTDEYPLECTSIEAVDPGLYCSFTGLNRTHDRLKIENIFPNGLEERDVVMVIGISNIYNPYSTQIRYFFSALAIVSDMDGEVYNIQQGETLWKAYDATGFLQARVSSLDTTVQEYTEFLVEFQPMIDIEKGAFVMVQFPTSENPLVEVAGDDDAFFQFDGRLIKCSTREGLFGAAQDVMEFTMDAKMMKIQTMEPTLKYGVNSIAKLVLKEIANPYHIGTFGSFRITIFDNNMYVIADQYKDIFYTVTTGNILDVQLSLGNYAVQKHSKLRVQFAPLHNLPQDGIIYIEIPSDMTVPCPTVFELNSLQLVQPLQVQCDFTGANKFTISNPFNLEQGYEYAPGMNGHLVINFLETVNAMSARNITGLTIETRTEDGELVDKYVSNTTQLTIVPSPFFAQDIITASNETFTDTKFTFKLVLADVHEAGFYFEIHIPPEVGVPDSITSESGYTVEISGGTDTSDKDPFILKVSGFDSEMPSGKTMNLDLDTLTTPKTTVSTKTFKIYSKDSLGRIINYVDSEFILTMISGKNVGSAKISTTSPLVGDVSGLVLDFDTPVPIRPTDQIRIMFPDEVLPPYNIDGKCQGSNSLADLQPNCQSVAEVVTAKSLAFRDDPSISRRRLAVPEVLEIGSKLTLTILGSRNPQSGASTAAFKFYIQDQEGNIFAEQSNEDNQNMKLTMAGAAPVQNFNFSLTDERQQAFTAVKIFWRSEMPYPKDSFIKINYREDQIGPQDKSAVKCSSNLQLEVDCSLDTSNEIIVKGMFADNLVGDTYLYLVISGLFNDLKEPTLTDSWVLTVFTEVEGQPYHIDQIADKLNFQWTCEFPCQTCSAGDPTQCYSCNYRSNQTIHYDFKCYDSCPLETYYNPVGHTCNHCDPNCKTCDENNGKICLTCDPDSQFPFLDGTTCKTECPFGSYGNTDESKCKPCEFPCQSCGTGPLDCNTCDTNSSTNAFFMLGDCKGKCDDGYAVPIGNADLVCLECNQNCKTCVNELDYCTSCHDEGETLLSMHDNRCYSECPRDITVRLPNQPYCLVCSDKCRTCEDQVNKCTSCKENSFLWDNICHKDCTVLKQNGLEMTLISQESDWTCRECQYPCETCQTLTDYCLTCQPGWVMFEYKCYRECPEKYTAIDGQCVLTGFFCPFGYIMENGNRCILDLQICVGTDILNFDKTKCIPQPDMFFPFPLLICVIIGTVTITYAKCKRFPHMRWIASMVSMLAFIEIIGLVGLVTLSKSYGIAPAFTLSFLALIFLIGLNLFCTLIYLFQMKPDSAFKYWEEEYEDSTFMIVCAGFFMNFKIHRMFYSRWWGKKDFEAVFTDEIMFYRSVMFSSSVYIVTCIVPIIISTIFVVWYVPYGYQLQMFGLEMFVIEVTILILLTIELYKIRKHFLQKAYYKVKSDEMGEGSQFKVMAEVPDFDGAQKKHSSYSVTVLEKVINRIEAYHASFRIEKIDRVQTIKEIQELREEEYGLDKVRRCVSFADLREEHLEKDEFQLMIEEGSDNETNVWENFISEPSSPTATWFPKEQNTKETLRNPYFNGRMQQLAKVYGTRGQFDNCYSQSKPADLYKSSQVVTKSKAVQANVLELLGVDDLLPEQSTNLQRGENLKEINQQIAEEEQEGESIDADMFSKGLVDNVVGNFEGYQERKKRRTLPPSRVQQLPKFEIQDIQGNFQIDEDGNFIIINEGVDENGIAILEDLDRFRVNQRGYLIDTSGNIVFRDGTVVFRTDEVDEDGEIPAPYCFMKKDTLGMNTDMFGDNGLPNAPTLMPEQEEEEKAIDEEYKMIKSQGGQKNLRYQQEPNDQEMERSMRSDELENSEAGLAPSKSIKRLVQNQPILYNPNDEDFIDQISKPMKPESKKILIPRAQKTPKSQQRGAVSVTTQQKSHIIRADNDAHTSIDADFLINGNIGMVEQTSFLKINDKFDKQDIDMDINADDINVPMGVRPASSVTQIKKRGKSSKTRTKILRPDQQALLLENTDENYKRDKEQEILDGIEKFQAMLKRYPLKARQTNSSRTLTLQGKQLNKVYGKIKTQYTKQIKIQDEQLSSAGGLQTSQQITYVQHRAGYKDGQCYLKNCSIHGNNTSFSGSTTKIHPHGQKRMKGLSTIYQQDLRNKARTGYSGGISTFSLKSNQRLNNNQSGSMIMSGSGNQSLQGVGSHLTKIMAINEDPSTYMAMDAGSFHEANSEHHLDEMRGRREMNEIRYVVDGEQNGSFAHEQDRLMQNREYQINRSGGEQRTQVVKGGLAQSFSGNRQIASNFVGYVDERASSKQYASNSSEVNAETNALLLKQNSSSSAYMRGVLGKKNTNLLEGAYL